MVCRCKSETRSYERSLAVDTSRSCGNGETSPKKERTRYLQSTKFQSFTWTKNRRICSTKQYRHFVEPSPEARECEPSAVVFYPLRINMALCNVQRVYMQCVRQE